MNFTDGFDFPKGPVVFTFIRLHVRPLAHPDKVALCDFAFMPETMEGLESMVRLVNQMQPDYAITLQDVVHAMFGNMTNLGRWGKYVTGTPAGVN